MSILTYVDANHVVSDHIIYDHVVSDHIVSVNVVSDNVVSDHVDSIPKFLHLIIISFKRKDLSLYIVYKETSTWYVGTLTLNVQETHNIECAKVHNILSAST